MLYGLKEARKSKGFTQAQLAEKLGLERTTYLYIENGKTVHISTSVLLRLKELGFSLDEIFQDSEVA